MGDDKLNFPPFRGGADAIHGQGGETALTTKLVVAGQRHPAD